MTFHSKITNADQIDKLAKAAADLGYEIVDIAGFLDLVEQHAQAQRTTLTSLNDRSNDMMKANADVRDAVKQMAANTKETAQDVDTSVTLVRNTGEQTRSVAKWVRTVSDRSGDVSETLAAVKTNNLQIAKIASQVNTLAINAKIEAARAGEAGRGFAVVAEAINDLSHKTKDAAVEISSNIETLSNWIFTLGEEASNVAEQAASVLQQSDATDTALGRMELSVSSANTQAQRAEEQSDRVERAMTGFQPALDSIDTSVRATTDGIEKTHARILRLIDTSESIVQTSAAAGGASTDGPFIAAVTAMAADLSRKLDSSVDDGRISIAQVFDRTYTPIPGTDPVQMMAEITPIMDKILPPIQEPALDIDPMVVFCAAIDVNGYLPTHNKKFAKPQSNDPVWNTANCRNRRIFDDRVGLKAGRNTEPFLLQVYRRDMGGGNFTMMKDLSAPIFVQGRHWGGLRLAYTY